MGFCLPKFDSYNYIPTILKPECVRFFTHSNFTYLSYLLVANMRCRETPLNNIQTLTCFVFGFHFLGINVRCHNNN